MIDQIILTPEGEEKLKKELDELKNVKRKEISEMIELAKEHGDLSENAEYQDARNEQSFIEGRIIEIENILKNSVVAESSGSGQVYVGSKVVVETNGVELTFNIVGSHEGEPSQGMLSCDSPIGEALMGKKVGEEVAAETPKGVTVYKIKEVT
ncbi:MAG: Transcription elongation factor GreA [Candidatus Giovannonibacteria bacterium GW2011_GWA2_53_7]|uniref:Transcription elongation factor GreA n=1 Tax=Candidatus Giovannonibacteria bacterium GW2011_GWA2_53_7 TaxID=1618650 RepID=A0A0G1XVF5_9BACT|nr:MAG: Transcription elongation factor GreA [Candidatus Giovannonibacteria bacterium GW2011_GWA2_53_7]HLC64347.1 transcription elongation factor GreA [Patescibacteria group bacterium]